MRMSLVDLVIAYPEVLGVGAKGVAVAEAAKASKWLDIHFIASREGMTAEATQAREALADDGASRHEIWSAGFMRDQLS